MSGMRGQRVGDVSLKYLDRQEAINTTTLQSRLKRGVIPRRGRIPYLWGPPPYHS
jgi:hypothetical protein